MSLELIDVSGGRLPVATDFPYPSDSTEVRQAVHEINDGDLHHLVRLPTMVESHSLEAALAEGHSYRVRAAIFAYVALKNGRKDIVLANCSEEHPEAMAITALDALEQIPPPAYSPNESLQRALIEGPVMLAGLALIGADLRHPSTQHLGLYVPRTFDNQPPRDNGWPYGGIELAASILRTAIQTNWHS